MIIRRLHQCFFAICLAAMPLAATGDEPIDALWRAHQTARTAAGRVVPLILAGIIYRLDDRGQDASDSAFILAQQEAAQASSDSLLFLVYSNYIAADRIANSGLASEYSSALIQIGDRLNKPDWLCKAYSAQARLALDTGNFLAAGLLAGQAFNYAALSGNPEQKAEAWILQGMAAEREKSGLEAFRCYLSALYLAEELESDGLKLSCYEHLSQFYAGISDYEKAAQLKLKEIDLYKTTAPYDTPGYMDRRTYLAADYFRDGKPLMATAIMHEVLAFSRSRHDDALTRDALEVWRSTLISLDQIPAVEDLYIRRYPNEFTTLKEADLLTYYRLKAYFSELHRNNTEARSYYALADAKINDAGRDSTYRANFYRRYGQFLVRAGDYAMAEQVLRKAEALNEQSHYLPYAVNISMLLDSVYKVEGKLVPAYEYARKTARYRDELAKTEQQDKLLLLELDHEARTRKLEKEREEAARNRHFSLQYTGITLIILSSFLVLVLLGSFKPRKWIIKAVGFISFIMLFEFIILLLDHRIAALTHEEPWKMLGIKIVLIAFLLPFHHWVEEKVVHYLYAHRISLPVRFLRRRDRSNVLPVVQESAAPPPQELL